MVQFLQQNVPNAGQLKIWSTRKKSGGQKAPEGNKKAPNLIFAAICN